MLVFMIRTTFVFNKKLFEKKHEILPFQWLWNANGASDAVDVNRQVGDLVEMSNCPVEIIMISPIVLAILIKGCHF